MRNARVIVASLAALLAGGCGHKTVADQAGLEEQFRSTMSGATLVGHSASPDNGELSGEERYVIEKATKLSGDTWLLQTRLQIESHDIPVPIPVQIKWAGDTPVITLTDLTIPGVGTYTARVLIYRNQYAGTWSGHDHGGQLFGKIVHEH